MKLGKNSSSSWSYPHAPGGHGIPKSFLQKWVKDTTIEESGYNNSVERCTPVGPQFRADYDRCLFKSQIKTNPAELDPELKPQYSTATHGLSPLSRLRLP